MALHQGWHGCRFDPLKVAPSGMLTSLYIYARKANMITQQAAWRDDLHLYLVEDFDTGDPYRAATLIEVMLIAHEREQQRLTDAQAARQTRARKAKAT